MCIRDRLHMSEWRIRKMLRDGKIRAFKVGTMWRVEPEALEELKRRHQNVPVEMEKQQLQT